MKSFPVKNNILWKEEFVSAVRNEGDCLRLNRLLQQYSGGFSIQTRYLSFQIQMLHFTVNPQIFSTGKHQHRFIELAFPLRDNLYQIGSGSAQSRDYDAGVILIPPGQLHSRTTVKKNALCFSVVMDLQAEKEQYLTAFYQQVYARRGEMRLSCAMQEILHRIAESFAVPDEFSGSVSFMLFNHFLIELMRENFPDCFKHTTLSNITGRAEMIRLFLEHDLTSCCLMEDLVRAMSLSSRHLNRIFRNTYGLSIKQWVIRERIRLAAHKLLTTDEQVKSIAHSCGFANMSYFTRQFKKLYLLLPSSYRQKG